MAFEIKKLSRRLGLSVGAGVVLAGAAPLAMVNATTPIGISSCVQLQKIGNDGAHPLSGSYVLTNDIDCTAATSSGGALYNSGKGFAPIGDSTHPFTGMLNGQDFTITGLKIDRSSDDYIGLFSDTVGATIENLHFAGASITGASYVGVVSGQEESISLNNVTGIGHVSTPVNGGGYAGGLIGWNKANSSGPSQLSNDYYGGTVTGSDYSVGGLLGDNDGDAVITESGSSADVSCNDPSGTCDYIGGLDGDSDGHLTISKSFATGTVDGTATAGDSVGGLVGWSDNDTISNSFATGNVISSDTAGGLLGDVNNGTVDKSYSSGTVTASGSDVGGLLGYSGSLVVTNSFFDKTNANLDACGDNPTCTGVTGLSSVNMKANSHFTGAGWDFASIWAQNSSENSGMPYLMWAAQASKVSSITGKNVEVIVPAGCLLNDVSLQQETSNATMDSAYSYPDGMVNFSVSCGTPGFAAQITSYVFGVSSGNFVVRKYNTGTHQYATVPGAKVTFVKINGESAAKIVYSVKDGSSLDSDGAANGTVVDPVGLAVAVSAPNTGAGTPNSGILPVGMLVLGGAGIIAIRKYSRR